ncbi:MAG TPA: MFS transporter [Syntrophomonadaceae bacterium]|nr:MFS transporter [Syntrophomonadaceae bacterium]
MSTRKIFYGWIMVVALFFIYVCMGVFPFYTGSVLGAYITSDPLSGVNVGLWGIAFTIFILVQGLPAPLIGMIVEKKGSKFTMLIGSLLVMAGSLLLAFFPSPATLIIGFSLMISLGVGMAGQLPVQTVINMWFYKRRALAMGIVMLAGGVGITIIGPVVTKIIELSGGQWNYGWFFLTAVSLVTFLLVLLFVHNRPENKGLTIDNGAIDTADKTQENSRVYKTRVSMSHGASVRTAAYWVMAFGMVAYFIPYNLCGSHAMIHFRNVGFDPMFVATGLSIMGVASLVARIIVGIIGDYIEPIKIMGIAVPIMALGGIAATYIVSPAVIYIYFLAIGFGSGFGRVCIPTAVANYFGPESYARNIGLIMTTAAIFSAFVPAGGGFIFQKLGSYNLAFIITGVLGVLAGVGCLFVKPPKITEEDLHEQSVAS